MPERHVRCNATPTCPLADHRDSDFNQEGLLAELRRWLIDFIYRTAMALYGSNMGAGRFRILREYFHPIVYAGAGSEDTAKVAQPYVDCAARRTPYPPELVPITPFPITELAPII